LSYFETMSIIFMISECLHKKNSLIPEGETMLEIVKELSKNERRQDSLTPAEQKSIAYCA